MIYKTLQRKQKFNQHEPHKKLWMNSTSPIRKRNQFLLHWCHSSCYYC